MSKMFYAIIRTTSDDVAGTVAVTPLLPSEEEAFKTVGEILEDDLEGFDYGEELTLDVIIEGVIEDLANNGWSTLEPMGVGYIYTLVPLETEDPDEVDLPTLMEDYDKWLRKFASSIRIPKAGDWYPKDFCIGALEMNDDYIPSRAMQEMGFEELIFPIDWKGFFKTGCTEFKDIDENEIEFNFSADMEEWSITLTVRVNEDVTSAKFYVDVDFCESKSQRMKAMSNALGDHCMSFLSSIHPAFLEEDDD